MSGTAGDDDWNRPARLPVSWRTRAAQAADVACAILVLSCILLMGAGSWHAARIVIAWMRG